MSIADSETAAQTAVNQLAEITTRWKAFAIDQHAVDLANRYLSGSEANDFIESVRAGLAELDLDNQLAALAATLGKI